MTTGKLNANKQTVFRQTQAEYNGLKKDAHRHEMNVSDYLRWLIEKQRDEDNENAGEDA